MRYNVVGNRDRHGVDILLADAGDLDDLVPEHVVGRWFLAVDATNSRVESSVGLVEQRRSTGGIGAFRSRHSAP